MTKINTQKYYKVNLVAFHITSVCSHRCSFCYAADDSVKQKHPPLNQLKTVIDALVKGKVKEVTFLGGDPGAYPDVVPLAKYAKAMGMKISILSNTLSFPNSSIEEAASYFDSMETTIHDREPKLHDTFCHSKGAYKKITKQLRKASEKGCRTGIAINITPALADKIFILVDNIISREQVPLDYVIIQRIIPFGRATRSSAYTLTRQHAEKALYEIQKIDHKLGIQISVEDPFPLCILPDGLRKYMTSCQWGFTKASVNTKGDLSRCGADPRYRLGNIIETPLLEIWNDSKILQSFRSRDYLPGRCQTCFDMEKCGGGCPLSCEIEKDHGIDYLYLEYETLDEEIHGEICFAQANEDELSSILQIEWSDFPGYGYTFTVDSMKYWFAQNPNMFWVVRDSRNWILGYATIVPISKYLFKKILKGKYSSLSNFPKKQVLTHTTTDYFHIEVVAAVPSRTASRAGRYLVSCVGKYILKHAKHVSTSPITEIGIRLCKYFGFEHVANEQVNDKFYPIYSLEVDAIKIEAKLKRF